MFQNINFGQNFYKPYNPDQIKLYRRKLALKIKAAIESDPNNHNSDIPSANMTDEKKALSK